MVSFRNAAKADIEEIIGIEKESFLSPWTKEMIESELEHEFSRFIVAEEDTMIVGYGCFWIIADEAHITNLAVRPAHRRKGYGKLILKRITELIAGSGSKTAFLEVRRSNTAAQNLYKGFGFEIISVRKNYYTQKNEDALIMALFLPPKK